VSGLALVLACLRALDVEEAVASLDGSGDSGDSEFDHVVYHNGEMKYELPPLTVNIYGTNLADLIGEVAADMPEGDWVNNEGGYRTVTFRPFETDPDLAVECDMAYRDEYEGDADEDFDDEYEEADRDLGAGGDETDDVMANSLPVIILEGNQP
jgi:hypothetical protein